MMSAINRMFAATRGLFAHVGLVMLACGFLAACTTVQMESSPLISTAPQGSQAFVLEEAVTGKPVGGNARTLDAGSVWLPVGSIAEGEVFKPRGSTLTAEGVNVHEAYIVVRDDTWVGFWLVVEGSFSPLAKPVPIKRKSEEAS